ncbi:transposase family protein [Rhodococcus sp. 14C212]|uniref:transposase family protein n=1 Tax=Rhodococcus sp. 14C212 TaxID=2711209 RepID=UPI001F0D8E1E|nr:transposase family protein [Rhodococcus sp. 14C212]
MVLFCDLLADGPGRCPGCGSIGRFRDTNVRTVTDLPVAGYPMQLRVRVPRYRCGATPCERELFRHNTDRNRPLTGSSRLVDQPPLRPAHPATVDNRRHLRRGDRQRTGPVLGQKSTPSQSSQQPRSSLSTNISSTRCE